MTYFPQYFTEYPNVNSNFPLHISLNRLPAGFPAHRHDFLEFSYVAEGEGEELVNGVSHPMAPGVFTFLLPYQIHEIRTAPGSTLVLYNCNFGMDLLAQAPGQADGWLRRLLDDDRQLPPYTLFEAEGRRRMDALAADLLAEYGGREDGRMTLLRSKLLEALVLFDRRRRLDEAGAGLADARDGRGSHGAAGAASGAWPIIQFVNAHFRREDLTLADLSHRFSLSASRISEIVKEATGQTFLHYLNDVRIRHASSLIVSTDLSMTEIAGEVGFGTYKTFARLFRERKGLVPSAYRRRERGAQAEDSPDRPKKRDIVRK